MSEYVTLEFIDEPTYIHDSKILRVGVDCTGIEAPIRVKVSLQMNFVVYYRLTNAALRLMVVISRSGLQRCTSYLSDNKL